MKTKRKIVKTKPIKNTKSKNIKSIKFNDYQIININKLTEYPSVYINVFTEIIQSFVFNNNISYEKIKLLLNGILFSDIITTCDKKITYKPETFGILLNKLYDNQNEGKIKHEIFKKLFIMYYNSDKNYNNQFIKLIINTLIFNGLIVNIYDPSYKSNNNFKELFE